MPSGAEALWLLEEGSSEEEALWLLEEGSVEEDERFSPQEASNRANTLESSRWVNFMDGPPELLSLYASRLMREYTHANCAYDVDPSDFVL